MTASNTYLEPYSPLASQRGIDVAGSLSAALNFQKGVDGDQYYATDVRQQLVWDATTFGTWTPVHGVLVYQTAPAWVTGTAYVIGQYVTQAGVTYVCLVAHTSGTFLTDLGATPPKWQTAAISRFMFDDFRGTIDARYSGANGGGAGAAGPSNTAGDGIGEVTLVTGTANGATACAGLTADLGWEASQVQPWQQVGATAAAGAGTFKQKLTAIFKAKASQITTGSFFLGFADILASTTVQTPMTLTAATLAVVGSTANCAGFLFDTGATAKHVWCVAANATTPCATPVDSSILGPALTANTYLWFKLIVDTSGNATFYMAPIPASGSPVWVQVGAISLAVAPGTAASPIFMTPIAAVTSRSATSMTLSLDAWNAV
ncbi:MAG: carbohydrate-binding protein [Thermoguttaceae bacterium]